jgi:hypothetical protein
VNLQDKPFIISSITYSAQLGGGGSATLSNCTTTQINTGDMTAPWGVFQTSDTFFSLSCNVNEQPPGKDLNLKITVALVNGQNSPYTTTKAVHTQ